jgi:hypothetical protein
MAIQTVNLGTYANDGTGDDLRTAFEKVNANFLEAIITAENLGTGSSVFAGTDGNSLILKTIKGGQNITVSNTGTEVIITASDLLARLEQDTNPTLGANLNLNGFNVFGGTVTANVTGTVSDLSNHVLSDLDDVSNNTPLAGQALLWNGAAWAPGDVTGPEEGIDFGSIRPASTTIELLLQATPIDFGSISSPNSLIVDAGWISSEPPFLLSTDIAEVTEGYSLTILLQAVGVTGQTVVPYTITGVTSDDIFGAALSGHFDLTDGASSLTFNITEDLQPETESFTLTLVDYPSVSITVPILDAVTIPTEIDGGSPSSAVFDLELSGGSPGSTEFTEILDGGSVV